MKNIEWKKLTADEIEVRPAKTKNGKTTLLLYQDSRCTMKELDRLFGNFGWEMEYKVVGEQIYGRLSIFDETTQKWVSKEDTGDKSNISEDKGQSSDILKRCAVRWGFARELYTAPTIIVDDDGYNNSGCRVRKIEYDNDGNISHLIIENRFGKEIFCWSMGDKIKNNITPISSTKTTPIQSPTTTPITTQSPTTSSTAILTSPTTEEKQSMLTNFCKEKQANGENRIELGKFYNYYNAKRFEGQMDVEKLWKKWKERSTARYAA